MTTKFGLTVLASFMTLLTMQVAHADSLTYNGMFYSNPDTVTINNASPSINEKAYSGALSMTDTSGSWTMGGVTTTQNASFQAWCLDIYAGMSSANYTLVGPTTYGNVSGYKDTPNTLTSNKVLQLEQLASNDLSLVTNAQTASAFQLAAWEIMAETGSTLSLSSGSFSASGDAAAQNQANVWLSNLGTAAPTMQLYVFAANSPGSTQDLAVFAPAISAVPEPETYGMLMAGLGLMGFMVRRKKNV